jgi:alkylation response protein AidB-like acyl-CoA dehydrogenase
VTSIIQTAEDIADGLLFPAALDTDAAGFVPRSHLDALAEVGLYGLMGPRDAGGLGADLPTLCSVIEALAGGCLTTTFVWIQHNTPVRSLTASKNQALRDEWLPLLCSGRRRAGIALGGLRAGPTQIQARRVEGGWLLDGEVPFVTGWSLIDVLFVAARSDDGQVVTAFVPAEANDSVTVERLRLVAANASVTVRLEIRSLFVPGELVVGVEAYKPPPEYDGGGRPNGSLSFGVARRCCRLIGPSALDSELESRRRQLDEATDETMASARAAAARWTSSAAAALVVARGSRSLSLDDQAQRLFREAAFLLVFGSRPAIRTSLLAELSLGPLA